MLIARVHPELREQNCPRPVERFSFLDTAVKWTRLAEAYPTQALVFRADRLSSPMPLAVQKELEDIAESSNTEEQSSALGGRALRRV